MVINAGFFGMLLEKAWLKLFRTWFGYEVALKTAINDYSIRVVDDWRKDYRSHVRPERLETHDTASDKT